MIVAGGTARRSAPYGMAVHVADLLGVLDDGGLRLPSRADIDADRVLDAVLGPAIARLRMTSLSMQEYVTSATRPACQNARGEGRDPTCDCPRLRAAWTRIGTIASPADSSTNEPT
jgi:hypothetical protein